MSTVKSVEWVCKHLAAAAAAVVYVAVVVAADEQQWRQSQQHSIQCECVLRQTYSTCLHRIGMAVVSMKNTLKINTANANKVEKWAMTRLEIDVEYDY